MKAKINIKNIISYIVGNYRYKIYYSRFSTRLIRPHIKEQIDIRINSMNEECYLSGQCVICGCATTALQMADKACDKPCYPPMLNEKDWNYLKTISKTIDTWLYISDRYWRINNNKFINHGV